MPFLKHEERQPGPPAAKELMPRGVKGTMYQGQMVIRTQPPDLPAVTKPAAPAFPNRLWSSCGVTVIIRWALARSVIRPTDIFTAIRNPGGQKWSSRPAGRSEEHTSEIQSLMRISYA